MTDLVFNIKKGDRSKPLSLQLKYETADGSEAVDLDGCTAKLYMRKRGHRELKIDGSDMSITNEGSGYLQYNWTAGDVDAAGIYEAEVIVTDTNSKEETFPDDGDRIVVIIHEEM